MESLSAYAQTLNAALDGGDSYMEFNRDMIHARIVVSLAFKYAEREIWLLSHKLDPVLYASPSFVQEVQNFLARGKLHILVESDVDEDHPIRVLAKDSDRVEIRRIPDDVSAKYEFNFMVVDDSGYRFEDDRKEPSAVVVFNEHSEVHQNMLRDLTYIFSHLEGVSTPI